MFSVLFIMFVLVVGYFFKNLLDNYNKGSYTAFEIAFIIILMTMLLTLIIFKAMEINDNIKQNNEYQIKISNNSFLGMNYNNSEKLV